tara:strand:+ start:2117 stop:2974 length:858 start_codon:yes stop_codon:yes gene_type:complete
MNGEQEPFHESKLERSLAHAGASQDIRRGIVDHIVAEIRDGMTTQEIYEHAFELLRQREKDPVAARYSVKRAVLELGPSGFPFEQFIAEIFKTMEYTDVETGVAAQGKCAPHEVDVMAVHAGKKVAAEVKFHNSLGIKTDLKVALYVRARFDDLKSADAKIDEGWLITNTRFTRNAARFGNCTGMNLLGWDYPRGRGLEVLINRAGVHPITALTSLTAEQKRYLLKKNLVLCRQLELDGESLRSYGVRNDDHENVRNEVRELCRLHSEMTEAPLPSTIDSYEQHT